MYTHLFVMSDQLSFHMPRHQVDSPQHLTSLQTPDSTCGVNARRACRTNQLVQNLKYTNKWATKSNLQPPVDQVNLLPRRLGSTSFQSKEVRGAQKSEFLLLFSKHSRRVSVSLTCKKSAQEFNLGVKWINKCYISKPVWPPGQCEAVKSIF